MFSAETESLSIEKGRRYEFIVNTSKELMALINREYRYEAVNDEHCRARNQPREEILGRTVSELWSPEIFHNTIKEPLDRCFAGQEVNYQAYYEHAAIGMRYMDVTCYPYYNPAGAVTHVIVVQRDITERERAEQSMRRYARRLETLHEIDRGILAAQSPEEIAEAALRHLLYLVPCHRASIVIFDSIDVALSQRIGAYATEKGANLCGGRRGRVFEVANIHVLAEFSNEEFGHAPTESVSFINVPLVVQGKLLGTLSMGSDDAATFAGEHADIAREVAYQVALAVQQAQLRQELHRYTTELEVLVGERTQEIEQRRQVAEGMRDILTILNSVRPLDEVLNFILTQAKKLLVTDNVSFIALLNDNEQAGLKPVTSVGVESLLTEEIELAQAIIRVALGQQQPIAIDELSSDVLLELGIEFAPVSPRYASILVAPLSVNQSGAEGALVVYFVDAHQFSVEEMETTTSLADQTALAIENARLYQSAEQLAVMEERERLARELHDSVTQSLYSLSLFSEAGQRLIRVGDTMRVEEYLGQLGETAQQALKEMRLLLYELRPAVLEQEGLIGALRRRLDAVEKRAGINFTFEVDEPIVLPLPVEEGFYRIAQEALNNSLKHAFATHVCVSIKRKGSETIMQIADNGVGFREDETKMTGGMGLSGMRERVQKLGGNLYIESAPNQGATITVHVVTQEENQSTLA
ncbi:MAG: GAF domain-containing protein [Caldilineaceae bacterium]